MKRIKSKNNLEAVVEKMLLSSCHENFNVKKFSSSKMFCFAFGCVFIIADFFLLGKGTNLFLISFQELCWLGGGWLGCVAKLFS